MDNTKYICDCIKQGKEFEFIEEVAKYYKKDYYLLCDYTLDNYNYMRRNGLDVRGSKLLSLQNLCEYASIIDDKEE